MRTAVSGVEEEILKVLRLFSCEKRMQERREQMKTDTSEHLLKEYAALRAKMESTADTPTDRIWRQCSNGLGLR